MRRGKNTSQPANVRAKRVRSSGLHPLEKMPAFLRSVPGYPGTLDRQGAAGAPAAGNPIRKETLHMKPINEAAISFLSRSANEGFARTAAACFAAQLDPTLDEVNDIKTAVSEAVTNAIVHAYPDRLGKVALRLRLFEDGVLEIVVKDWGVGIEDVEKARQPLYTTGSEERSGMGFTIMESFMDALRVRSTPGKGTTVTMRRRISRRYSGGGR